MSSAAPAVQAVRQHLGDYFSITKPRVMLLVVLTAWAAMWLLAPTVPAPDLVICTLLGTALAVGSSHTFNALIDRDIDAVMTRTQDRPLPNGRLQVEATIAYGVCLGLASFALLAWQVNWLSGLLAMAAEFVYVIVYTIWLKRRTPWNTLIGGIAGAIPPLIGCAAVVNRLEPAAWLLFAAMVLWQPPHVFSLALYRLEDYRRANVAVLPVVRGERPTAWRILLYVLVLAPVSLGLYYPLGVVGAGYAAAALLLGVVYVGLALRAALAPPKLLPVWGRRLFLYSLVYLTGIFVALVIDRQPLLGVVL